MKFIITTSLIEGEKYEKRKEQYINGIEKAIDLTNNIANLKMIIIENNGKRSTFLDNFKQENIDIFYTNNNLLNIKNKGVKELKDILDCINFYDIKDDELIIKMTGRYVLNSNSNFINVLKYIKHENTPHCIITYGSFYKPVFFQCEDCITGLIGMLCKYIKTINMNLGDDEPIEWHWAKASFIIPKKLICKLKFLGLNICPGNDIYFCV